jgi:hypothetical protein
MMYLKEDASKRCPFLISAIDYPVTPPMQNYSTNANNQYDANTKSLSCPKLFQINKKACRPLTLADRQTPKIITNQEKYFSKLCNSK